MLKVSARGRFFNQGNCRKREKMPDLETVAAWLEARGIEVLRLAAATPTASSAAAAIGCSAAEIAKSVLFIAGGEPVMVVTAGDMKVRSSLLKQALGRSGKIRLPDAAEVLAATGYLPGGVCPFLLPDGLPVLVDRSLARFATVYPAAGDDHSGVPLTPDQLLDLAGGTWVETCQPLVGERD
jgi:prolyl-tRNA editing enzyme YbaK/EbsC (Cys-tRNA(Pro) deacylase)